MVTVRRRSKVETELPRQIKEELNRLLLEGATYEDAALYLQKNGFDISRSSIGRYGKVFLEAYQKIIQFEDQSRALASEVGEGMLLEEATTKLLLQKVMGAIVDGSYDVLEIPRIISDVAKLQISNVQREKLKAEFETRAKKAASQVRDAVVSGKIDSEKDRKRLIDEVDHILGVS